MCVSMDKFPGPSPVSECSCYRSFLTPVGRTSWRPTRDREPTAEVRVVAFDGDDPAVLRMVRVPDGWHARGIAAPHPNRTGPELWTSVGQCWAGREHPVVDVTDWDAPHPCTGVAGIGDAE